MDDITTKTIARKCGALIAEGDHAGFDIYEKECVEREGNDARDLFTSFRAQLELELSAREAMLGEEYRPKMWWMRGPYPGNFGDVLTPYVLWHAFGVAPRWTPAARADGIAIGSIAKVAKPGMKVWGTGMPRPGDALCAEAIWTAVRGPMSRQAVLDAGGDCPAIYGDPAVLLPELYNEPVEQTTDVGIIPHVLQEASVRANVERVAEPGSIKVISLLAGTFAEIEAVIREIRSCREIVSTSLHGVIVAHAYGIPCQSARIVKQGEIAADSFKMRDYKASVELVDTALSIPNDFDTMEWLAARNCILPPASIDTTALRGAFPFPARTTPLRSGPIDVRGAI